MEKIVIPVIASGSLALAGLSVFLHRRRKRKASRSRYHFARKKSQTFNPVIRRI